MSTGVLNPTTITAEAFEPFGNLVDEHVIDATMMNSSTFRRFDHVCELEQLKSGDVNVGIASCERPATFPHNVECVERHPFGSQTFIPLAQTPMIICVAPPNEPFSVERLKAFVTNGYQGITYRPGTWHMPLIGTRMNQRFLFIEPDICDNCEVLRLSEPVRLEFDIDSLPTWMQKTSLGPA